MTETNATLIALIGSPTGVAFFWFLIKRSLKNIDDDIKQALAMALQAQKEAQDAKTGHAVLAARVDALIASVGKLEGLLEKISERQNHLAEHYRARIEELERRR